MDPMFTFTEAGYGEDVAREVIGHLISVPDTGVQLS
jgi:hypothetical protein